jgi:hypothetical protein
MSVSKGLVMKIVTGLAALPLVLLVAAPASAAVLQIQFSGLNLTYTGDAGGGTLCDSTTCNGGAGVQAESDPLTTMSFLLDGNLVGNILVSNIWADVSTSVVAGIPTGGGTVTTSGGIFDILSNTGSPGWGLALNLGSGLLTYNAGHCPSSVRPRSRPSSRRTCRLASSLPCPSRWPIQSTTSAQLPLVAS